MPVSGRGNIVVKQWMTYAMAGALVLALTGCPRVVIDLSGVNVNDFVTPDPADDDIPAGEPQDTGSVELTAIEAAAFDAVNAERTSRGLGALTVRDDLVEVARAHSEDMIARGYFAHVNPDGEDPFDRMHDAGITYNIAGENLAWNNYANPVEVAVDGWMESAGHRDNILRASFTHAGMGVAVDQDGRHFFTQVFIGISKAVPEGEIHVYYFAE